MVTKITPVPLAVTVGKRASTTAIRSIGDLSITHANSDAFYGICDLEDTDNVS